MVFFKTVVFHVPYLLPTEQGAGSAIRPQRMFEAFQNAGHEVILIDGTPSVRKRKFRTLLSQINSGKRVDLVYSESSSMPNALVSGVKQLSPFLDAIFLTRLRRMGVPIALFYRDIYWKFPEGSKGLSFIEKHGRRLFYYFDLLLYRRYVDILYLPSLPMSKVLPMRRSFSIRALPPGASEIFENEGKIEDNTKIHLLYVGAITGEFYNLEQFMSAVSQSDAVTLTVCCRQAEWAVQGHIFSRYLSTGNISVVHKSGDELADLYADANICVLAMEPNEYRKFANPVKLFEYMGYIKPIIATLGTYVGDFVAESEIGWSVEYSEDAFLELFRMLAQNTSEIERISRNVQRVVPFHSWGARVEQVIRELEEARNLAT